MADAQFSQSELKDIFSYATKLNGIRAKIELSFLTDNASAKEKSDYLKQADNLLKQLQDEYHKILVPTSVDVYISPRWKSLLKLLK